MTAANRAARAAASDWEAWKQAFLLPEGRVVDGFQGGISHSEGQAYAMVLAVHHGDLPAFERLLAWTDRHLAVRRDPLLAWRWRPEEDPALRDYNNASDGDLFFAWALLRGAHRFQRPDLMARAEPVARALAAICLARDPRGGDRLLLLPGAEGFRTAGGVIFNPSYVMPRAMHDLAAAFDVPALARAAEDGADLIWQMAVQGAVPDWAEITAEGWGPSDTHPDRGGFDAVRVPLWMVWSARAGHPATRTATAIAPEAAGYQAVAAVAAGASSLPAYDPQQPYYPATLHLLAQMVAQEMQVARP